MLAFNPVGIASGLTPGSRGTNGVYTADLLLMEGDMPLGILLEDITSKDELLANFDSLVKEFGGISISTTFNFEFQERVYKKTPVDALPFENGKAGKVGWAAIVFAGGKIMYTDEIGLWEETDKAITLDKIDIVENEDNILKDVNLVIRDKSTYEVKPAGIFS